MKTLNLVQGSQKWLSWRKTGVTATDISILTGSNPYKKREALWDEKNGFGAKTFVNSAMKHGSKFEPIALENAEKHFGVKFENSCVEGEKGHYLASLDGLSVKKETLIEIKCPFSDKVLSMLRGEKIPEYWMDQIRWQASICNPKEIFLVFYDYKRSQTNYIEIDIDKNFDSLKEKADEFWNSVVSGECERKFKSLCEKDAVDDFNRLGEILDAEKALAQEKKDLRSIVIEKYGHHRNFDAGQCRFQTCDGRKTLDTKAMVDDGMDLEKYYKTSKEIVKISKIKV